MLQDQLDALKAGFRTRAPADILETMQRATAALVASGQAGRALKAGAPMPSFALTEADGDVVRSDDLLARGPLVISFYRGVWCPYCNLEMKALQAALPDIQAAGASLVAISPQTPVNSRKAKRENGLDYPVLSDPGGELAHAFGLRFDLPDDLIKVYKGFGNDLPSVNADPSWTLPMPGRFVTGSDGLVVYAEVNPDYTRRPDPAEVVAVLERLAVPVR